MSTKYTCRYCEAEASPRNLLRIETLPNFDTVVHVCDLCFIADYQIERAGAEAVLAAEVMCAAVAGDEAAVTARLRPVASSAALFLL